MDRVLDRFARHLFVAHRGVDARARAVDADLARAARCSWSLCAPSSSLTASRAPISVSYSPDRSSAESGIFGLSSVSRVYFSSFANVSPFSGSPLAQERPLLATLKLEYVPLMRGY